MDWVFQMWVYSLWDSSHLQRLWHWLLKREIQAWKNHRGLERVFLATMFLPVFSTSILYLRKFSNGGRRKPRFTKLFHMNRVSTHLLFHIPTCCWCWHPEREFQKELAHCCPACKGDVYKLPRKFLDHGSGMRQVYEKCNISPELHQVNDISLSLCTSVYHSVTVELNDVTLM